MSGNPLRGAVASAQAWHQQVALSRAGKGDEVSSSDPFEEAEHPASEQGGRGLIVRRQRGVGEQVFLAG